MPTDKKFKRVSLKQDYSSITDIGLSEFKIINKEYNDKSQILYTAVPVDLKRPEKCPACGKNHITVLKTVTRQLRDLESNGYQTAILLYIYYYKCQDCNHVIVPEYESISGKLTTRLKERIQDEAFRKPFAEVARDYNVSAMTVKNLFMERANIRLADYKLVMPEVLGIDEVHLKKNYYGVFVRVDQKYGDVIELSPKRTKEAVIEVLSTMEHPENLKLVTMDMWQPYRDAVRELFPNVPVVIDKFHVIKALQNALEKIRHKISKKIQDERKNETDKHKSAELQAQRRHLRNNRYLLLGSSENLSPMQVKNRDALLANYPEFNMPYVLKEAFRNIYETAKTKEEALKMYAAWKKTAAKYPEFKEFIGMIKNWEEEIFAFFDIDGDNRTNAQTESLNNLIKSHERAGRGVSYEVIRAKLLFRRDHQKPIQYFNFDSFKTE